MRHSAAARLLSKTLLLPVTLSLFGLPATAQTLTPASSPMGVYGGGAFGIGAHQWDCGSECDRAAFSGKVFGGKRLTPGLAAEINYFVFGTVESNNDPARTASTGLATERRDVRAVTFGINWEVELLHGITNHLRVGVARKRTDREITLASGARADERSYGTAPYVGASLSYQPVRDVRLLAGFDYIIDGRGSNYLFSVGASGEF